MIEIHPALFLLVLALGGLVASRFLVPALAVLAAALPLYVIRFSVFGLPTTLLEFVVFCVLLGAVVACVQQKVLRNRLVIRLHMLMHKPFRLFSASVALFFIASIIAVLFSAAPFLSALGLWRAYILEPLLIVGVILVAVGKFRQLLLLFAGLCTAALGVSAVAWVQWFGHIGLVAPWDGIQEPIRSVGIYPFPNALALFLVPIIPLVISCIVWGAGSGSKFHGLHEKSGKVVLRYIGFGAFASILIGAVLFSRSEGGIIATIGGIGALLILNRSWKTLLGAAVISLVLMLGIPSIQHRTQEILSGSDTSTDVRVVVWQGTLRLVRAHPFVGAGFGGFPFLYPDYKEAKHVEALQYPHMMVLNAWVELGLLGLLSFIGLIVSQIALLIRIKRQEQEIGSGDTRKIYGARNGMLASLFTLFVHGLVDVPYFKNDLAIMWWMFAVSTLLLVMFFHTDSSKITEAE